MVTKFSHRTPSRAMTLAEMEIGTKSAVNQQETGTICRSTNKAKRLVDLLGPSFSSMQALNSGHQSERKYATFKVPKSCSKNFTTSKMQIKPQRHENPTVRRTINFMSASQVDDNHKMYPTISSKLPNSTKDDSFSTQLNKKVKIKTIPPMPPRPHLTMNVVSVENAKRQSHINFEILERQIDTELQLEAQHQKGDACETLFTQYRDINNSFNVSSCEQSPTVNIGENHTNIYDSNKDTPNKSAQLSDSICELMNKAELTSNYPDISKQLLEIRDQLQENITTGRRRKAMIMLELKKNQKCLENINELLKIVSDSNTRPTNTKQSKSLPSKQQRSSTGVPVKRLSLRPRLSVTNTPNTSSNTPNTLQFKIKHETESPNKALKVNKTAKTKTPRAKNIDLRKVVLMNTLDNSNIENVTPSKKKKSFQMYTSLKNSLNFLKTPNGKKNVSLFLETPNSKSRHATSSNIKEQLERLYDD